MRMSDWSSEVCSSDLQARRARHGHDGWQGCSGSQGETAMIASLIEGSLRNKQLVLIFTALAVLAGVWAVKTTPLDAIPDLSDVPVIIFTEFPGQAPQVVEAQEIGRAHV